jgi:hypothetical protein
MIASGQPVAMKGGWRGQVMGFQPTEKNVGATAEEVGSNRLISTMVQNLEPNPDGL